MSWRYLLVIGVFVRSFSVLPQGRDAHWILYRNHVDFSEGTVVNNTPFFQQADALASMADPGGQLLFFISDSGLYNGNYELMSDSPIPSEIPVAQGGQLGLIVPIPGSNSRYQVFVTGAPLGVPRVCCKTLQVDMALNGGAGNVVPGSFLLLVDTVSCPLTAIRHTNGTDYWVVMHKWDSDIFLSYRLTGSGVDPVPIVSHAGPALQVALIDNYYGTLNASLDGQHLAFVACDGSAAAEQDSPMRAGFFDFDAATGTVSFRFLLDPGMAYEGMEISPDGSKLYLLESEQPDVGVASYRYRLLQYDLLAGNDPAILISGTTVFDITRSNPIVGSNNLLMALDGRIYVSFNYMDTPWLGVVQYPDSSIEACGYVPQFLAMANVSFSSLPNRCKLFHDSEPAWLSVRENERAGPVALAQPNPMAGMGELLTDAPSGGVELIWYDAGGRRVRHEAARSFSGHIPLNTAELPPDLYLLRASSGKVWQTHVRVLVP